MRAAVLLYTFALLAVTACAQRTAGAIEFADGGTPTVVATRATAAATVPVATATLAAATPTVVLTVTSQPATNAPTSAVASPTAPPPTAIATATQPRATPSAVPTAVATQAPATPAAVPTGTVTQAPVTPSVVPTAISTEPSATPLALASPTPDPVFAFPTAELPVGMPGPNSLVYQAFWNADLRQSGWRSDSNWTTADGLLINNGAATGPSFASPFLMGNAGALERSGNYAVEAQIDGTNAAGGAFGIYIRRGSAAASQPRTAGLWRGGVADRTHAFILAEQAMTQATPADLLLAKSLDVGNMLVGPGWVTYRLEAHDIHVALSIGGQLVLQTDDARFDVGDDIGLWADHAAIRVRDFRLYTLP